MDFLWRKKAGKLSGVVRVQRPKYPLLVVLAEKGLSKLIAADHNGTGRGNFDQSGDEPWQRRQQTRGDIICCSDGHAVKWRID